jgi:hypothetical protein
VTDLAHLPAAVLDGYLRHALSPDHRQQVRAHLDTCEPCWNAWNRYRWDSATSSPVYAQLVAGPGSWLRCVTSSGAGSAVLIRITFM